MRLQWWHRQEVVTVSLILKVRLKILIFREKSLYCYIIVVHLSASGNQTVARTSCEKTVWFKAFIDHEQACIMPLFPIKTILDPKNV